MYSGISGLRTHQTMMDVVGNNIANVNTAGYKSSAAVFQDVLSQTLQGAAGPRGATAGRNPAQVGLGVQLGGISTNWSQGASQLTGRATDLAIQGDGFFAVQQGGETLYTRAGSFNFDANGTLVTPSGGTVLGWAAQNGVINPTGPLAPVQLPVGQTLAPTQTSQIRVGGNLPADAPVSTAAAPTRIVNSINVFDAQGASIPLTLTYEKTAANAWTVTGTMPAAAGGAPVQVTSGTLTWDATTQSFGAPTLAAFTPPATVGTFTGGITVALGNAAEPLTQFAGTNSISALEQDGAAMGSLQSFSIAPDGTVMGVFSNGMREPVAQVALANFANPGGLEKVGSSLFRPSANSGLVQVGVSGEGGRGSLSGGTVEMSNVDLAQEFTNLIVAQRGFQANSRVISSSDELLQDLVNLKR
jgi:flagellar hook protein FlgE